MTSHLTDSTAEALAGVESGDVVREEVGGEEAGTGTVNTPHHRQVTAAEHPAAHPTRLYSAQSSLKFNYTIGCHLRERIQYWKHEGVILSSKH